MAVYSRLAVLALAVARALAQVIPPSGTLSTILPRATDAAFGPFVSDGGAGGYVSQWGHELFSISDGAVCTSDTSTGGSCYYPTAHAGMAVIDPTDPTKLIIMGDYHNSPNPGQDGLNPDFWRGSGGEGIVPYIPSVDNKAGITNALGFAPAPHVAPIPIPGNSTGLLNVYPIYVNETTYSYNTMYEMNWVGNINYLNDVAKKQVPIVRTAPLLFNVSLGAAGYGSSMLLSGRGSEANTYFYAWEFDDTGFKVARAPWSTRSQITTWQFWKGYLGWQGGYPLRYNNDAYGNVYNISRNAGQGFWGARIRWVDRFQTYVITFSVSAGSDLLLLYSTTGSVLGPYAGSPGNSAPAVLTKTTLDSACSNRGGYPYTTFPNLHWDYYGLNASKVLVSWISCTSFQNMAVVSWLNGNTS